MKNKYFNDAIIGNGKMLASFDKNGQMLRLFYPNIDYKQHIDFFHTGVTINKSDTIWLHKDVNNDYKQYYTEDTNIINTEIFNKYFNLKIKQTDFVTIEEDMLVKKYTFLNESVNDLEINFIIYSKLNSDVNNYVSGYFKDNSLMQYTHDNVLYISSKKQVSSFSINDSKGNVERGEVSGKDYIGMSSDSSISYDIGIIKPGEQKEIIIYIHLKEMDIKKVNPEVELEKTKKYWIKYLYDHKNIILNENNLKVEQIYKRSILLFPLLTNKETGGIEAAVEVDENMHKCGRYSYCWPRDAVFITRALDACDMGDLSSKFYKEFCKNTQSKNGRMGAKILY